MNRYLPAVNIIPIVAHTITAIDNEDPVGDGAGVAGRRSLLDPVLLPGQIQLASAAGAIP